MKKIIIFVVFFFSIYVEASSIELNCPETEFNDITHFTCVLKLDLKDNFNKVELEFTDQEKIDLLEVRSNFKNVWKVKLDDNKLTASTINDRLVTGKQEFAVALFITTDYGKTNIEMKDIKLINSEDKNTVKLKNVKKAIKTLSSINTVKEITINGENIKVPINSEEIIYYKVKDKETEFNIKVKPVNENSKLTYDKKINISDLNEKYVFINVESENKVNNVYTIKFYKEKIDIKLNSFSILDETDKALPFIFDSSLENYYIEVDPDIDYIEIKPEVDKDVTISKKSELKLDLKYGNNIGMITLYKDGNYKTYIVNIFRLLAKGSSNAFLDNIKIEDYKIKFNKRINDYYLTINSNIDKLAINVTPDHKKSSVYVMGNEDLKDGSSIRIIVTAENGKKNIYTINIEKKFSLSIYKNLFFYVILIATTLLIVSMTKIKDIIYKYLIKTKELIIYEYNKPRIRIKPNGETTARVVKPKEEIIIIKFEKPKKKSKLKSGSGKKTKNIKPKSDSKKNKNNSAKNKKNKKQA